MSPVETTLDLESKIGKKVVSKENYLLPPKNIKAIDNE
jgi:hypothetical protein